MSSVADKIRKLEAVTQSRGATAGEEANAREAIRRLRASTPRQEAPRPESSWFDDLWMRQDPYEDVKEQLRREQMRRSEDERKRREDERRDRMEWEARRKYEPLRNPESHEFHDFLRNLARNAGTGQATQYGGLSDLGNLGSILGGRKRG